MTSQFKQPAEAATIPYDFGPLLGALTITGTPTAVSDPLGAGANMTIVGSPTVSDGQTVLVRWAGGADGEDYLTTVSIVASDGQLLELDGVVKVRAVTFPAAGVTGSDYLDAAGYLARFGEYETEALTQEADDGQINEPMVQAAIDDATADAESFLVGRYDLVAVRAAPPAVLIGFIADLARERLHIDRPSDEVTARADRARTALKEFANGTRSLVIAAGTAIDPTISTGSPAYARRDEVFSDDNLAGFGGINVGTGWPYG